MDQQQYRMEPNIVPPKRENRFLRIWGPLLIKWGIGIGISMFAMFLIEGVVIIRESGLNINNMQDYGQIQEFLTNYLNDTATSSDFMNKLTIEFLKYTTPVQGVAALVTIPILMIMFHRDRIKERISGFIPNKKAAIWKYSGIVVMVAAMTIGLNNLIVISGLSKASESYEQTLESFYTASIPVQILCLGILIPLCEEYVFRGLMFRRLRQTDSFLRAAIYSSLVFGFFHINIVQTLYGFVLGMLFCYFYEKYGSVKAPILAHIVANIISVILTEVNALEWMAQVPLRMGIITVACASVASTMYVLIQRIDEKP